MSTVTVIPVRLPNLPVPHRDASLAKVDTNTTYDRIENQLALVKTEVATLERTAGPEARGTTFYNVATTAAMGTSLLSAMSAAWCGIGSLACLGEPVAVLTTIGAVGSALLAVGTAALCNAGHKKLVALQTKRLTTTEVAPLLVSFERLTPAELSALSPALRTLLEPLRKNLSAKAEHEIDAALAVTAEAGPEQRALRLYALIERARGRAEALDLAAVGDILHASTPDERRALAEILEARLFENERYVASGDGRATYTLIGKARAGESPIEDRPAKPPVLRRRPVTNTSSREGRVRRARGGGGMVPPP